MLVGDVVVEDDVDHPAGRHLGLDRVQEAHELLMAVALHVAADDGPVEDVERSKQGRGAMALVVVRHGAEPALLQRQARQGAIESLDLALLVERKHDGVGRRIDGPGTSRLRHDHARRPNCDTAIEGSAQGTSGAVWAEPQDSCQVA